jgi:hypothetical protein
VKADGRQEGSFACPRGRADENMGRCGPEGASAVECTGRGSNLCRESRLLFHARGARAREGVDAAVGGTGRGTMWARISDHAFCPCTRHFRLL